MLGDLNSNLAIPWQLHGKLRGSPCESPFHSFCLYYFLFC
ncbi:hypothetical protein E2C01_088063 [Portunus trituberculatus]|uniref:Uncharacterized protein n=1 Tax=Portunus trituberculatus TaxID=210409 RepID=A0A5B7J874_PORTR|nr:hypothetical protein [Portunus trituberculatus]